MIICAVDLSSTRLDACFLEDDLPPRLMCERLGTSRDPLIERVRRVPAAVDRMLYANDKLPDWFVPEQPAGRYGLHALLPIFGAITASVPAECQIGWRKASEWRHDLGAKNTKEAGHAAVSRILHDRYDIPFGSHSYDEHALDALGVAFSWASLLEANALGATPRKAS